MKLRMCPKTRREMKGQELAGFKKLIINFGGNKRVGYVEVHEVAL